MTWNIFQSLNGSKSLPDSVKFGRWNIEALTTSKSMTKHTFLLCFMSYVYENRTRTQHHDQRTKMVTFIKILVHDKL